MRHRFPLTLVGLQVGLFAGLFVGLLTYSYTVGLALFVLCVTLGLTWRRDQTPIFPFILAHQWSAVTLGYFYFAATGIYPSAYATGDIERTAFLSLMGLLVLAAGIRLTMHLLPGPDVYDPDTGEPEAYVSNITGLFKLVMLLFALDYVYIINTKAFGGLDVILDRALAFRWVLLLLLWFEILRRRAAYKYLLISMGWVFVPLLGSYFSDFKLPWLLLFIVYMSYWRPWDRSLRKPTLRQTVRTAAVATIILFLALVWQAGVKKETRRLYNRDLVAPDPLTRVSLFVDKAGEAIPFVFSDTGTVVEGLIERVSYITFFSRVLEYVPATQPHTRGELLKMAVTNTVMPRFLFPEKPVLPSDSSYTRRFTGIMVSEEGTSISIGYMAEFYVDWGLAGMYLSILFYGCQMGLAAFLVRRFVTPAVMVNPVMIIVLMVAYQFEHQFIKTFAALNVSLIVLIGMSIVLRRRLVKFLRLMPVDFPVETPHDEPPAVPRRGYKTIPRATTPLEGIQ